MVDSILQSTTNNKGVKLDPRTKLLLLFVVNIVCISGGTSNELQVMRSILVAIPIILLYLSDKRKMSIILAMVYVISLFSWSLLLISTNGIFVSIILITTMLIGIMLPGFITSYYIVVTTTVSEFIAAMERMKIPQKIVIPFVVMFRFFPTLKEEHDSINDAMRMRGITLAEGNPIKIFEYRVVPLLMSTVKIGEELSAAALTRGLNGEISRTNICDLNLRWYDIGLLIFCTLCLVLKIVVF